jgi:uncharacterized membrane protein
LRSEASQLVLSSSLAVVLLAARIAWTRQHDYAFLVWNLFLAWVPYGCTLAIRWLHDKRASHVALVPLFARSPSRCSSWS